MKKFRNLACLIMLLLTGCVTSNQYSHAVAMTNEEADLVSQTMLSYIYDHYPVASTHFSIQSDSNDIFAQSFTKKLRTQGYGLQEVTTDSQRTYTSLSYQVTKFYGGILARVYIDNKVISRHFKIQNNKLQPASGFSIGS